MQNSHKSVKRFEKKAVFERNAWPFFSWEKVQISHGKHIRCGKSVKFEDYSEIHGLCSEGLVFDDYATIGRGIINPSSYYGGDYGIGLSIGEHGSIGLYCRKSCAH